MNRRTVILTMQSFILDGAGETNQPVSGTEDAEMIARSRGSKMDAMSRFAVFAAIAVLLAWPAAAPAVAEDGAMIDIQARKMTEAAGGEPAEETIAMSLDPKRSAVIVCDMWNQHWCAGANKRVEAMLPRVNELLGAMRKHGTLIIHAPSGTMDTYKETPQRKRAMEAPHSEPPVPIQGWCHLEPEYEVALPIDDSDGGCDCDPQCPGGGPWVSQHPAIVIAEEDAVSDSGQEIYNLLAARGIENVFILGVHTNMCVLGRPFGIRQMNKLGKNIILVRDLTDTMYNHRMPPYVPHEEGTELVIRHIERYWAPTVLGGDLIAELR